MDNLKDLKLALHLIYNVKRQTNTVATHNNLSIVIKKLEKAIQSFEKEIARWKVNGWTFILWQYGEDDYSLCVTDNPCDDSSGGSVRGSALDIMKEISNHS